MLENPDLISKPVLAKGLDAGTAFEILSIDIADVDVGENIGAKLQTDQAEGRQADRPGQGRGAARHGRRPSSRRCAPGSVVAEAEVPQAMAEAFRQGNLGIMDYYRMKNIQADTTMRETIAGSGEEPPPPAPRR